MTDREAFEAWWRYQDGTVKPDVSVAWLAWQAALASPPPAQPPQAEPVAEVGPVWSLVWAGQEPLATLLARHPTVRIGTKLYAAQPPQERLTDEAIQGALADIEGIVNPDDSFWLEVARAIERLVRGEPT